MEDEDDSKASFRRIQVVFAKERSENGQALARVIHAYPTQAEAIRMAVDAYSRTRLTPTIRSLLQRWLAW